MANLPRLEIQSTLSRRRAPLASAKYQLERLAEVQGAGARPFEELLSDAGLAPLTATGLSVLQINVGKVCNQTCNHCHVDAGPDRKESMSRETAELCMRVLADTDIPTVDITGGAPELNPQFRYLVEESRRLERHVLDRCNLTVLTLERFGDLPQFLAEHQVEVVASLPHYRGSNTDRQRGEGVFERSLEGLRRLNEVGYGREENLKLTLVTNPVGAFLPAGQASLEDEWKREMHRLHGIEFDELYTITNMPISRFLEWLDATGNLEGYLRRLVEAFNPAAAEGVMCRTMLSVGWDGRLFDCDFNQMLELGLSAGAPQHLAEFDPARLAQRRIRTDRHCFGCTAGAGSSCGGAIES